MQRVSIVVVIVVRYLNITHLILSWVSCSSGRCATREEICSAHEECRRRWLWGLVGAQQIDAHWLSRSYLDVFATALLQAALLALPNGFWRCLSYPETCSALVICTLCFTLAWISRFATTYASYLATHSSSSQFLFPATFTGEASVDDLCIRISVMNTLRDYRLDKPEGLPRTSRRAPRLEDVRVVHTMLHTSGESTDPSRVYRSIATPILHAWMGTSAVEILIAYQQAGGATVHPPFVPLVSRAARQSPSRTRPQIGPTSLHRSFDSAPVSFFEI